MKKTKELCYKFTNLSEEDIEKLIQIANILPLIANIVKADVFINCLVKNSGKAIVVAEAKPVNHYSMYDNSVVGEFALRGNEPAVIRTLEVGIATRDLKAVTQEQKSVKQTVEPIKNKDGKTIGVLIIEKDITEKIIKNRKLEILAETNEQLTNELREKSNDENNITYHIDDAFLIFNSIGAVIFRNPVAYELYKKLGYKDPLFGMNFNNLSLDGNKFKDIIMNKDCEVFEVNIGNFVLQIKYIVQHGENLNLIMLIKDITDVKQKEKELILKSVAIKEIHHRVKNNLQTIASLLRLQSRRTESDEFKNVLSESMNRILSIAATHEILAQEGIDEVDIKDVILKIKDGLVKNNSFENTYIDINVKGNGFPINSDKSTSIGLIVNELLQNCLKHAFQGKENGSIEIQIDKGNLYSTVSIIDNGIGFDINSVESKSLGLSIVKGLVKDKLNGNLSIHSDCNGTKVLFEFERLEYLV
ncbi:sensor histidine kinase [Clostridium sediminicola]|uniref:sensor histidine kinase n=1 Tax=Clostridium sediminicola TaxID=3114879 RepID=UPI0031F20E17